MKILFVFLAIALVFLAGYGGVLSLEKSFEETPNGDVLDGSEHVECAQNLSDNDTSQNEIQDNIIIIGKMEFYTSLESGYASAKITGKPIFLYLHSKSCGWCKRFNDEVLTDDEVVSTLKKEFISVAVEVNEQRKTASEFNIWGTPTMVFLDEEGVEFDRIRGFVDAQSFNQALDRALLYYGGDE